MIKGVNKQIIEIKCPKDEQFEKILLFVNAENRRMTDSEADEKAKLIAKKFLDANNLEKTGRFRSALRANKLVIGVCASAFVGMLAYALAFFI